MAFIDFDTYYTPGDRRWNPEDGPSSSIGTTQLFFRKALYYLERSYEGTALLLESEEDYKKGV